VFPWKDLDPDLQDKILRKVVLRFVFNQHFERQMPLEAAPLQLPLSSARNMPYVDTIQSLVIQRSRSNIEGYGPNDTLTVSFSDCVDRGQACFNHRLWEVGYDEDAACRAMDIKCTWTGVFKIRLVFNDDFWLSEVQDNYDILFVRRGVHGNEEVVAAPTMFSLYTRGNKEAFARRLVEELRLTRRIVAGCDEFTC
jgi:hypothetical protein